MNYREPRLRKRGNRWQIDYVNPDGIRRQLSAGSTRQGAERFKAKVIGWLLEGKDPEREMGRAQRQASVTLDTFFDTFYRQHGVDKSAKTLESYNTSIKNIRRATELKNCPLSEIRYPIVQAYQEARKAEGASNRTINMETGLISLMLDHAVRCQEIEYNPLRNVKYRLKEPQKRDVDVSAIDPEKALALCTRQYQRDMLGILFDAGLRKRELLHLRVEEVHFPDVFDEIAVVFNVTVKGGKRRQVGGGVRAREILKRVIADREEGWVFPSPRTGRPFTCIHKGLDRVFRDAGLTAMDGTKFRIHDTRHWGVSSKLADGWSLEDTQAFYGHDSRLSTERYRTIDLNAVARRKEG